MNSLKQNKKLKLGLVIAAVLILAAAVIAAVFLAGTASVYFYTPSNPVSSQKVLKGTEVSLDPPALIEGYTFVGWKDQWGNMESRKSITVYEDTYYSAVYSVSLNVEEHNAYLFPDEYGFFRPSALLTRGDAALMFYSLLSVDVKGSENFLDIPDDSPYYDATAALKELRVAEGSRFHPDEPITRRELLGMLAAFFPAVAEKRDFADLEKSDPDYDVFCTAAAYCWIESGSEIPARPDETITRLDAAILMNKVLGRTGDSNCKTILSGFVLDISPYDKHYCDVAEAVADHSYSMTDGSETWLSSIDFEKHDSGFYLAGTELYYLSESGCVLKNTTLNGFSFDENGRYTCGIPELDELVQAALAGLPDPSAEPLEMLKEAYDYVVENFSYIKGNIYDYHEISWVNEEAYTMFSTGYGNCYSFAAAFYQLARALGYDAKVYSGFIGLDHSKHGWVEMDIDGETYVFDPEMEMAYLKNHGTRLNMFMMTYEEAQRWCYIR